MKRNFRLCLSAAILIMAALATTSCTDAAAPLADEPAGVPGTPAEDLTGKPIQIGNVVSLAATNGADTEANGEAETRAVTKDDGFPVEGSTMTVFCFVPDVVHAEAYSPAAHANYIYKGSSWQLTNSDAPLCWQNSTLPHFFAAVSPAVDDTEVDFGAKAKAVASKISEANEYAIVMGMKFDPAFNLPTTWTNELYTTWGNVRSTNIGGSCDFYVPKANTPITLTLCRPLVSINIICESTQVTLRNAPAATSSTASLSNPSTCAMQMLSSEGLIHRAYTLPYTNSSVEATDISFITDAGASKSTVANKGLMAGGQVRIIKEGANMSIVTTTAGGLSTALNGAGTKKKIVIGGTINDADMSALSTFCYNNDITDVGILAEGVTSIGAYAFGTFVRNVTLPKGLTSIGDNAFHMSQLININLPEELTRIGNEAFAQTPLRSINLPKGLTSIGYSAFNGCSSLESISLPDRITSISEATFSGCISLKSVYLPKRLMNIRVSAFDRCTSLTSISLPDGVTSIEIDAFDGCSNLEEISLSGINDQYQPALPALGSDAFANTKLNTLYLRDVPEATFKENLSTYSTWGGITWKAILYDYNGPDDDLYHTDATYYSGHWLAPTPQP